MTETEKTQKPDVRRRKSPPPPDMKTKPEPVPVSAGAVDKIVDLVYNPTREKIPEMTVISVEQGRLLPQLGVVNLMWQHVFEIAAFRQDQDEYLRLYDRERPISPNLLGEYTYLLAQWQKSIGGTNLKSATDIALAEIETKGDSDGDRIGGDGISD
ncbi:MAG: hypothetical protein ACUZ8A_06560 [Candidatus Bathyanammoxibius sp.]